LKHRQTEFVGFRQLHDVFADSHPDAAHLIAGQLPRSLVVFVSRFAPVRAAYPIKLIDYVEGARQLQSRRGFDLVQEFRQTLQTGQSLALGDFPEQRAGSRRVG